MTYILDEEKPSGCIFCMACDGRGADDLVLGVGEHTLVMMNKYPYNNGHILVAPRRHLGTLQDLTQEEKNDLIQKVELAIKALKKLMNPQGFNVGLNLGEVAGAGIAEHLHFHVVPRWGGDVNFMTVMGEVRVIPEHIRATYEKLKPHFAVMEQEKRAS
jgi:ATP adenylyltransferase